MKIPFLNDDSDPDPDTLAEKLSEKRSELADVREQHANANEVVEEREQTLRELRARREVGADVDAAIAEVEEELEEARKKRSNLSDRVDALEQAIPLLQEKLEEAREAEVQELYDELAAEIKDKVVEATEHLSRAAELQAAARVLAHRCSALVQRHEAEDTLGCYGRVGANHFWALFPPADVADNWISGDEKFSIVANPRSSSPLESYLDTLEEDDRIEGVVRPDPVTEGTTRSRFDE